VEFCSNIATRFWLPCGLMLVAFSGCSLISPQDTWTNACLTVPHVDGPVPSHLIEAEASYAEALEEEAHGDPQCIDSYFETAASTWLMHSASQGRAHHRASQLYRSALRQLVLSASSSGRFDPRQGVQLCDGTVVPVSYYGFSWKPENLGSIVPVGDYTSAELSRRYAASGVGVPLVILARDTAPYQKQATPFAATVLLRPRGDGDSCDFRLEFYDPLSAASTIQLGERSVDLARDLSAPIAYQVSKQGDSWWTEFVRPGNSDEEDRLYMIEPYQPGKIPVVFVHGLLSDPLTWANMANDLRSTPEIVDRYQFWDFRYTTGDPFLTSAAELREQLVSIRKIYDPCGQDPAFSQMVLVGHSMGGIVAKLQATSSGNELWQAIAKEPFNTVITDQATRQDLKQAFFFLPSVDVASLIFIGTPHCGSDLANRPIGWLGSALVKETPQQKARREQLARDNPGLFRGDLINHAPTSIELLKPDSPLLAATNRLPYKPGILIHSIVGAGDWTLGEGPSDGVVAIKSSRLYGVCSEKVVYANHEGLQRDDETVREVARILFEHLRLCDGVPCSRLSR